MHKLNQHVQHESTRRAYEVRSRKGVVIGARGTIAFASIYTMREGIGPKPAPLWYVERRLDCGTWITAARDMQGRDLAEARRIVKGFNRAMRRKMYRVVTRNVSGGYDPE